MGNASKATRMPLEFRFDIDKFIACVALFAKEKFRDLDTLKVCKLLYYVDKYHMLKYGRPVIGDSYVHMDYGPVPSTALDILHTVTCNDHPAYRRGESIKKRFEKFLHVSQSSAHGYPVFELVREPDLDSLSESEQEAVRQTIGQYGKYAPPKLTDLTHAEAPWKKSQAAQRIDYRLFFEDSDPENRAAMEYMEIMAGGM